MKTFYSALATLAVLLALPVNTKVIVKKCIEEDKGATPDTCAVRDDEIKIEQPQSGIGSPICGGGIGY